MVPDQCVRPNSRIETLFVEFNEFVCDRIVRKPQQRNRVQRAVFNDEGEIKLIVLQREHTKK